jgi:signal transduction histidine kinase
MAVLGQLTATVSHELRNPLGVIRTSAFIVNEDRTDANPRVQRAIERIERSVVRCDRIIDELLDFTRISDLEHEPTALDSWLDSTLSEQVLPSEVELRQDFNMAGIDVAIDRDRIRRAVINVFDNACQAMTDPAHSIDGDGRHVLTVTTRALEDRIEIVFVDNGPGIPADVRPMIFEPLFSTKGFGVGLGLPTVKQIMEQHGGGIDIDSAPGQGARIRLWLPRPSGAPNAP